MITLITLPQLLAEGDSVALGGSVDQLGEGVRLQARAAHQAAVHVLLRHDLTYVPRLDRTAIEDPDLVGEVFATELPQKAADTSDRLLRVLGGGHVTGPDGPDRLVGKNDIFTVDLTRVEVLEDRPNLSRDFLPHSTAIALLLGLPDADDGEEAALYRPDRFTGD